MQDLLAYVIKGLSDVTTRLRKEGKEVSAEVNHYVTINLFTIITNANFDDEIPTIEQKSIRNKRRIIKSIIKQRRFIRSCIMDCFNKRRT